MRLLEAPALIFFRITLRSDWLVAQISSLSSRRLCGDVTCIGPIRAWAGESRAPPGRVGKPIREQNGTTIPSMPYNNKRVSDTTEYKRIRGGGKE